jgi:hypothetical protein
LNPNQGTWLSAGCMNNRPFQLIFLGFVLLLLGVILPLLMVMHVIPSTFFLNFFSYTASLVGLILGIYGSASYMKMRKPPRK